MSWNDDLERRHYERLEQSQKQGGSKGGQKYNPWQMEKLLFNPKETFFIRVLRPMDAATYRRKFHWPAGSKFPLECTEDHPDFFDPTINKGRCSLCMIFSDKKDRGKQKTVDVMEVIDFRFFHIVPDEKKGGDRETIERCMHDEADEDIRENMCHLCASGDERIRTRHFGGHKVFEMPDYQYQQLWAAHSKLSNICISVIGQNEHGGPEVCHHINPKEPHKKKASKTYILTFICRHCEDELLEDKVSKAMSPIAKEKFKAARQQCRNPQCSQNDFPLPIYACDSGKGRTATPSEVRDGVRPPDGEHWVIRGSMFDKPLEVTIAAQIKPIKGQKDPITLKNLNISTGSTWSSVADDLAMFGFDDEQIAKICEPWDLNHRYRPSFKLKPDDFPNKEAWVEAVLREQAEAVNRPYPFQDGSGGSRSFASSGQRRSFRS